MNVNDIRKDFPMLNKDLIYFDNAATSLKPKCVIEAMNDYYFNYGVNIHRGDYNMAAYADNAFDAARKTIASFINANPEEIIYTSGTTESLNIIASIFAPLLVKENEEIVLNIAEHASNILPWQEMAKRHNINIKYASLNENGVVTLNEIKKVVTSKTRLISIAHVSNVLGCKNEVEDIITYAHSLGIIVVVDGAQAVPHMKVDVKKLDADFYVFSAHKMCGPTGIGVIYGKEEYISKMPSFKYGGGMNVKFTKDSAIYRNLPYFFEGGTPAIAEIIGFAKACEYLTNIGMDNIEKYEAELKEYAVSRLEKLDNIVIYNKNIPSGIITFNDKKVFCQDEATYLSYKKIAVRSGHHCAKLLPEYLNTVGTVRASLYFYNTKEEIDEFVKACETGGDFLDAYFK